MVRRGNGRALRPSIGLIARPTEQGISVTGVNTRKLFAVTLGSVLSPTTVFASQSPLEVLFGSTLTVGFILLIAGFTIFFVFIRYDRFAVAHGPEVLTTIGIFGCFLGIAIALLHFDATDLTNSVPKLLDGVKTAFWASVTGVFGSLLIRMRHRFDRKPIPQSGEFAKAASLEDVVTSMVALRQGLVGQEEGTLLTQFKLMRQEATDHAMKMQASFDNFARHMVENNQKAIIEALKEVIRDFNQKLTEQFGENFKQLNSAVGLLVQWQQNYKEELAMLIAMQRQMADDLRISAEAFREVVQRAQAFEHLIAQLASTLALASSQQTTLAREIEALATVFTAMKDVTPQFQAKTEAMLDQLREGITRVQAATADAVREHSSAVTSANAELKTLLTRTITDSQREVQDGMAKQQAQIREAVLDLDKALKTELTAALEMLSRQLGSLSTKFVADYRPLTESLRELVRMAGNRQLNFPDSARQ